MTTILTVEQLAEHLAVHPNTIRARARRGELPAFKVGRRYRFHKDKIDALIARSESGHTKGIHV